MLLRHLKPLTSGGTSGCWQNGVLGRTHAGCSVPSSCASRGPQADACGSVRLGSPSPLLRPNCSGRLPSRLTTGQSRARQGAGPSHGSFRPRPFSPICRSRAATSFVFSSFWADIQRNPSRRDRIDVEGCARKSGPVGPPDRAVPVRARALPMAFFARGTRLTEENYQTKPIVR